MRSAYGSQQSDAWLRARVGRITGSRLADVCSYLTRKSGLKEAGDSSATRDKYKMELIAERLTGRAKDHYVSPAMEFGTETENDARLYYEGVMRVMCEPVGFVLHDKYSFTGASADSLVGPDGVLEIKCPETTTHLGYVLEGQLPENYVPQVAWELACTGRKFADFVSFDPRIADPGLRFFYRRTGRDELEWEISKVKLTGESVIDYFTAEVLKMNAEIEYFFAEHNATPIAPYEVELIEEVPSEEGCTMDEAADFIEEMSEKVGGMAP